MSTPQKRPNNYFDGMPVSGKHKEIFFIIMLAYFFEQMDNWNFGFISSYIFESWGLTHEASTIMMGKISSWYFLGMTIGGLTGGFISDIIGRRKTFLISIVIFSGCSIINGLPIDNHNIFIAARALTGFGVFCMMVCSQGYIAEMAPAESRGKWQSLVAAVGFAAVPVIAFLCLVIVPRIHEGWRIIFYLGGLGFAGFALAYFHLLESPRWLVSQGRKDEAEAIIERITHEKIDLSDCAKDVPQKSPLIELIVGMFKPQYIKRTLLLMFVFISITPAGFIFTTWTGKLLADHHQNKAIMLQAMVLISCGVPAGCFFSSRIADLGGRKIPLAAMLTCAGIVALAFANFTDNIYVSAGLGFALSVFNMAASFILFSYCAESYPTRLRNTATGLHNGLARFSVTGAQMVVPLVITTLVGPELLFSDSINGVFTLVAFLFVLPVPFILLFGLKTSGRSLEDIS